MDNKNMTIYEAFRKVPASAQKAIGGGRLKGFTDINPMWRIKMLTETFGACGFGWYYTIDKQWMEEGNGSERAVFVNISLYVKQDGEWSMPIQGTGGSMLVKKESANAYTDDECYKKALTDAISVACKALGMGADVYWDKDRTKYTMPEDTAAKMVDDVARPNPDAQAGTAGGSDALQAASVQAALIFIQAQKNRSELQKYMQSIKGEPYFAKVRQAALQRYNTLKQ